MKTLAFAVGLLWLSLVTSEARAQCGDAACLHAGTAAVTITNSQSQLLDSTMSSLLGQTVDLTPVQHQSLTNASVNVQSLLATLQAQGLANSTTGALTAPLTVAQLTNAIDVTLTNANNPTAASAVRALGSQASGVSGQVALSSILTGDTSANILNQSSVNTLDLLSAIVATNNLNTARSVQTSQTSGAVLNLGVNIGAVTLSAVVLDQPVFVCGPTGVKFYSASIRVRVHAALSNQGLDLNLGVLAVKLGLTALDLVVSVARGSGTLKTVDSVNSAVTVEATPGVAELYLGTVSDAKLRNPARINQASDLGYATIGTLQVSSILASATAAIEARAYALGINPIAALLSFNGPFPQTRTATTSATFVTQLVTSLLNSLEVRITAVVGALDLGSVLTSLTTLVLNTLKTTTNGVLATPVTSLLSGAVDPLLSGLGVGLGRMDVTVDRAFKVPVGSACDDLQYCTENDVCGSNNQCAGTPRVCDDGLSCTDQVCDEANDRCTVTATTGCTINGACYAEGAINPANPCQQCTASTSQSAWTNKSLGASCSDGQFCTTNDACNILGSCVGTPIDCNDGLLCTLDQCDEAADKCTNDLTIGCAISGTCYLPDADNPQNNCQSCDPGSSPTSWTNKSNGTTCSDNLYCTVNDACDGAGNCASTARDCNDNLACTLDVCSEQLGACVRTPTGGCLIGGACYGAGAQSPLLACQECNPALSTNSWSNKAEGTSCSDNLYCTVDDTCNALGLCLPGPARNCNNDGLSCTNEVCNEFADRCDPGLTVGCVIEGMCVTALTDHPTNPCLQCNPALAVNSWSAKIVGAPCSDELYCTENDACDGNGTCTGTARDCGTGGGCSAGVCNEDNDSCSAVVPGCNIGGTCYAAGALNPLSSCMVCDPARSTSLWTLKDVDTSCSDGFFCTTGDKCNALGACVGTALTCAPDLLSCTNEVCNELTDSCEPVLQGASCLINSLCFAGDTVNPDNPCQRCVPMASATGWTNVADNESCSDGLHCTENDKCVAGVCLGAPRDCTSSASCATGTCNEITDRCDTAIAGCLIDSACYVALQANPQNPCQICDPSKAVEQWTAKPLGSLCSDGAFCTVNDACDGLGGCASVTRACDDGLGCTVDACSEQARACVSTTLTSCLISGCVDADTVNPDDPCEVCKPGTTTLDWTALTPGSACSDGSNCTSNDSCGLNGSCTGTPLSCNDGLSCTSDVCDENSVTCKISVLLGCAIDGACYADGDPQPGNSCRRCAPEISVREWTNKPVAAPCSDGNNCTVDACNGAGTCVSTTRDCNDNLSCTEDTCNQNTGSCVSTPQDSCVIAGQCVAGGTVNPLNDCQTCDPIASKTDWSNKNVGDSCTGGLFCTVGRTCSNVGVCTGGSLRSCDDGVDCSIDACDEVNDTCTHVAADGCVVQGVCVLPGTLAPGDSCKVCNPLLNLTGWSTVPSELCLGLEDPDLDGLPTNVECPSGIDACPDTDEDGIPDYQDPDDDGDTVFTTYEHSNDGEETDTDQDGTPNHLDSDDDGDRVSTRREQPDPNANGIPTDALNTDDDNTPDYLDADDDGDGIPTSREYADAQEFGTSEDEDQDGSLNWHDTDSDGDEHSDHDEDQGDGDVNNDDVPDYLQPDVPADEMDAGVDAGVDSGAEDAGVDAGRRDAGVDSGVADAGADAGFDAGFDAGPEDAGPDASVDAGGGISGSGGPGDPGGSGGSGGAGDPGGTGGDGPGDPGGSGGSGGDPDPAGSGGTGGSGEPVDAGGTGEPVDAGGTVDPVDAGGTVDPIDAGGGSGSGGTGASGGSGGTGASGGSGGASASGGSGGASASGGSGGTGASGGSGGRGGSGVSAGGRGGAGSAGRGGRGGSGGRGGRGGAAAEGGSGAPNTQDAGSTPRDAGAQVTPDAGTSRPDAGSVTPEADGGMVAPEMVGGLAGGSSARCSVTMGAARGPDLSTWMIVMVGGLLAWRRRRT